MKILFYRGEEITTNTVMNKAEILFNGDTRIVTDNFIYYINDINKVETVILKPLGTMIKMKVNHSDNVFITVPRIYLEIASGFVIVNTKKTYQLKNILEKLI